MASIFRRWFRREVAGDFGGLHQFVDVDGVFEGGVGLEGEVWGDAEAHFVGDLAAEVDGGEFEGGEEGVDVGAAEAGHEGGGVAEVGADADFGDGDVLAGEVGVAEFAAEEDAAEDVADFFADAELALGWGLGRSGLCGPLRFGFFLSGGGAEILSQGPSPLRSTRPCRLRGDRCSRRS